MPDLQKITDQIGEIIIVLGEYTFREWKGNDSLVWVEHEDGEGGVFDKSSIGKHAIKGYFIEYI